MYRCPLCGHENVLPLSWERSSRMFQAPDGAIVFSEQQARIFNALWHKRHIAGLNDLAEIVYGDEADGGPDGLKTLSVTLHRMRARLEPLGFTISRNRREQIGWQLQKLEAI